MSSGFEHNADTAMTDAPPKDEKKDAGHGHSHEHVHGESHAKIVALGTVTLGGATFAIDRDGQVEAGAITEFGVELIAGSAVPTTAWLANPDGTQTADPVVAETHDSHWHFNVEPLDPIKRSKFVLQVGEEEAVVDFCRGAEPTNEGILSVFNCDGVRCGFMELKLHGDAGDLELFLYEGFPVSDWKNTSKGTPFDVPKETVITLTFPKHEGKSVTLKVRNEEQNEDEDGNPNMRGGCTNYFIFPGESDQDPAFLIGETVTSWRGLVTMSFEAGGKSYYADPFVLVPHDAL